MITELEIQDVKPDEIFIESGADAIVRRITDQFESVVYDVSTDKGRKECISAASKVAKSKVYLDTMGKDYVSGLKEQVKVVDAERKKIRDSLDALKVKVRQPVTDWEDLEQERVSGLRARLISIEADCNHDAINGKPAFVLESILKKITETVIDDSFEEYEQSAAEVKRTSVEWMNSAITKLKGEERQKKEFDRLVREKEERDLKEKEDRIAREATNKAERKAEQDIADAEQRVKDAEARAETAKQEAIDEVERVKKKAEDDEAKRRADEDHINKIYDEIEEDLQKAGVADYVKARECLQAGSIRHVTINY